VAIVSLRPFGEINTSELEEYYEGEVRCGDQLIPVDLNFEDDNIETGAIKNVKEFLDELPHHEKAAFDSLLADFNRGRKSEVVRPFMEHHLKELGPETLTKLFGTTSVDINRFLSKMVVTRVGFYPETDDEFAVFDITLQGDFTNYLIAVNFDPDGEIKSLSMES